jgi:hypothetical protein
MKFNLLFVLGNLKIIFKASGRTQAVQDDFGTEAS